MKRSTTRIAGLKILRHGDRLPRPATRDHGARGDDDVLDVSACRRLNVSAF
jgi:hypothetical protein